METSVIFPEEMVTSQDTAPSASAAALRDSSARQATGTVTRRSTSVPSPPFRASMAACLGSISLAGVWWIVGSC